MGRGSLEQRWTVHSTNTQTALTASTQQEDTHTVGDDVATTVRPFYELSAVVLLFTVHSRSTAPPPTPPISCWAAMAIPRHPRH